MNPFPDWMRGWQLIVTLPNGSGKRLTRWPRIARDMDDFLSQVREHLAQAALRYPGCQVRATQTTADGVVLDEVVVSAVHLPEQGAA